MILDDYFEDEDYSFNTFTEGQTVETGDGRVEHVIFNVYVTARLEP